MALHGDASLCRIHDRRRMGRAQRMGPDDSAQVELRVRFKQRRPDLYGALTKSFEDENYYDERGYTTEAGTESGAKLREF